MVLQLFKFSDAVKQMKKYSKCDTIDIENPLKFFLSGAKFRDPKQLFIKKSTITTND